MFPMYVGMNRTRSFVAANCFYVPHVCGDEPRSDEVANPGLECSPCMWG